MHSIRQIHELNSPLTYQQGVRPEGLPRAKKYLKNVWVAGRGKLNNIQFTKINLTSHLFPIILHDNSHSYSCTYNISQTHARLIVTISSLK